jgi:response regulator RpfG family c-di-GMP phosphodiesterase
MPGWGTWVLLGVLAWFAVSVVVGLLIAEFISFGGRSDADRLARRDSRRKAQAPKLAQKLTRPTLERATSVATAESPGLDRQRVLVVDDDPSLRLLLRTTLPASEFDVQEADSAESAAELARFWRPEVVILDVGLPGVDGLSFSRQLKSSGRAPEVILLTGADLDSDELRGAGADAILRKPFSPIELVTLIDQVSDSTVRGARDSSAAEGEQLLIYARDLSRVVERERRQRRLLQQAYRQTVTALADALEAKDPATGLHGRRVQHYGLELAAALDATVVADPSLEYGFLLHDVGKIGIPETILQKPGPLSDAERRLMQQHPLLGVEILSGIPLLAGAGLDVVRSHHERWDGTGYPDGLAGDQIPIAARIFALADTLDAISSDRPYRGRQSWNAAVDEILLNSGSQFDPRVVAAFAARERQLRRISTELSERAA